MTKRLWSEWTADRISNLPGDLLIHRILVFLPIKEAARTSLLSRSWRHRWRTIPQLVFDGRFAPLDTVGAPDENDDGEEEDKDAMFGFLPDDNKVMTSIREALFVHFGPITKFKFAVPGFWRPPKLEYPELHSSLFSAFDLKRLKLRHCGLSPPSGWTGFSKLTILQLKDVALPCGFFESFIPKFPLLEELRVTNCDDAYPVFVSAPSLRVLFFQSHLSSISFQNTPVLSVVSVLDPGKYTYKEASYVDENPDMVGLFAPLSAIEHLDLGLELLLFLADGHHVPYQLPTSLHNLKSLEVPHILLNRLPQAQVLVCLIMSAPNLQRLTIRLDDADADEHPPSKIIASLRNSLEREDRDQPTVCCLQHLEEFSIQDSCGTQVELDLIRFVLASSPVLRRITIYPAGLSAEDSLEFVKEVTLYKRASKEAKVSYV